ncbi:SAM-dependent methyltransferase [Nannocystis sp. RBIL2]|uniref:class I SAM-dependent methyltransferase n=1 Tax=Nannocystis sp. RBIL2 TaxID=2996788 RepID=UPI0022711ADC|nr:SAM-dependent methyltransferase [Nannocystis sp. RBIL2]MCY1066187.1 SAM-dependent methyltransferase [Nannocystis sp. RBIL2]
MLRRAALLLLALTACRPVAEPAVVSAPDAAPGLDEAAIRAIVEDPARPAAERELDPGRKPEELLRFLALRPGMRLADLGAGRGYTTFLLARAVGPDGVVYAQNNKFVTDRFLEPAWTERLKTPELRNVVRVDREFDDPLPPEARDLDGVINVLFYHDTYWMGTDRTRMNQAIFAALRPGGFYVIVDHSARAGAGASEAESLHRVEESTVVEEVLQAGFERAGSAEFLRNPDDPRDWNAAPSAAAAAGKRGTADRFVVRFVKPANL